MDALHLARDKFRLAKRMSFDAEGIEMATPETVAAYRAGRLACDKAVDLCCGIGGDAIALARVCDQVVAVDKDANRLEMAKANCEAYGLDNVEFVLADALEIDLTTMAVNAVFADPSRRMGGRRVSRLQDTLPRTDRLAEMFAAVKSGCIEASPRLAPDDIPWDCEREYLSLDGAAHCLSLYFGEAKRCARSAAVVRSEDFAVSRDGSSVEWTGAGPDRLEMRADAKAPESSRLMAFFHEPDAAIAAARLEPELAGDLGLCSADGWLTSDAPVSSPFVKDSYEVVARFDSRARLPGILKKADAGKVVLRGRIDPAEQLKLKASLESGLSGTEKLHVFLSLGVVARSLAISSPRKGQRL